MDAETLEACAAWAEERYAPESEVQRWVRAELETRDMPLIHVSPLEGRVLALLAASVGATRLLEVGTLGGYSALWLVSLLAPGARLLTIERDPERADLAREAVRRAGEEDRIRVLTGDARAVLEELASDPASEPLDLVFVDADKKAYPEYLERACELLRPGGLLLADNVFWSGRVLEVGDGAPDPSAERDGANGRAKGTEGAGSEEDPDLAGILEFDRRLADDPRLQGVILPVRDGLAVARLVP